MTQNTKKQQANPWLIKPPNNQEIRQERRKSESIEMIGRERRSNVKQSSATS